MIKYSLPKNWIKYNFNRIANVLAEAKAAVLSLKTVPYQRSWVEKLQKIELKMEVAGTSRIEGADFTEKELDEAIKETPEQLLTRSQRQAHAATNTYRWIANLPDDMPINRELIEKIHYLIVKDADDDHCEPGVLRKQDQNVIFGRPRHRGVNGGKECKEAFIRLCQAIQEDFQGHDLLIQALALHYHFASMHPFIDGNGRTARALEALILQKAGLRDTAFIAMSNYYNEEKMYYLESLAKSRSKDHNLTPFLEFGLKGIARQSNRLLAEIQHEVSKALFSNMMFDLFNRLKTPRKRVIVERQIKILQLLLEKEAIDLDGLISRTGFHYKNLKNPYKALIRDINELINLGAVRAEQIDKKKYNIFIRLEWPTEMTETNFFERLKNLPKAKTYSFLS